MTTIYTTFIYLDSIDPSIDDGAGAGKLYVKLMEPIPIKRHSSLIVSVHSMDIPVPNSSETFIPRKIRVKCSTPSTAQSPTGYNNTILQIYSAMQLVSMPGDFSLVSYRDSYSSGTGVQLLDPYLAYFVIYLTDDQDQPYVPTIPFDIVLKVEVVRNYQAEHLEQLNKVVAGVNLLLLQQDLKNPLDDDPEEQEQTYLTQGEIYGPIDNS